MDFFTILTFLLPVLDMSFAQNEQHVPWGCGFGLKRPYTLLCDLETIWGVVVEGLAVSGALVAILLALVLLCRIRSVTEAEKRSSVGPILLLLIGIVGLFGLTFAYLIEQDEVLCIVRRALWGMLFALCFSSMLAQGVRQRRLVQEQRIPGGCALTGLVLGLTAVQGIVAAEWLLLTVLRQGQKACQYEPIDFALACSYVFALLFAALVSAVFVVCGKTQRIHSNVVWLLVSCVMSILLWAAWLGFYIYGNAALGKAPAWDAPTLAVALVAQGWMLLLFHAVPEAHACLQPPPQPSAPDYFDTSQNSSRIREASYEEDIPLSHRQFLENQGYVFEENAAGLRSGVNHNANTGARFGAPFRSNVYQPTEMTMIMNGGAVPSAPPTYTGRQLW